jgi:diaminohydroxyphosphoribosylaminopyrimidine deaminase / 5-amino-6-(5-phosphoribosylamino)uracil reductase
MCAHPSDRRWLMRAIELSRASPPSLSAFSVGAIVVDAEGTEISRGYSRETDGQVHAEEAAFAKLHPADARLRRATLYSSLEPCSARRSRPRTCTELIIEAGLARVVFAWREPDTFVADCRGAELLEQAGITVVELADMAALVHAANSHLLNHGGP